MIPFILLQQKSQTVIIENVSSVDTIDPISTGSGTAFASLPLPSEVLAIFASGNTGLVSITWLEGTYNPNVNATYTLFANIVETTNIKNPGSVQATMDVTVTPVENSLFFTGASSQLVNFGTAADVQFLHTDPLCVDFFFKIPANPVSTNDIIIGTINTGSQDKGFEIQCRTTGQMYVELRNTNGTNRFFILTDADFADNQWHRLNFNKPANHVNSKLRIDAVEVAHTRGDNLSATISTTDAIVLGGRVTGTNYWDGYIDTIAVWDTDQEANVVSIYNAHNPMDLASKPIHYWDFDGSSYLDTGTSATKLTGTPTNSPVFSTDVPPDAGAESFQYRIEDGVKANVSEEAGYFQWGGNVIEHAGTYYMIGNKWIDTDGFSGWVHDNRIYIGSSASKLGPFSLVTEISVLRTQAWAADMVTNPNIIKIGATYYLYYVGTNYTVRSYPVVDSQARNNQRIGVASASSPAGPWTPSANNPILEPSVSDWDQNLVNNPAVYVDGAGDINMVYKSDLNGTPNDLRLGKVKLTTFEGPVTDRSTAAPNFGLPDVFAEDPCVWFEDGKYWAIFKAMDSAVVPVGNGILAVSDDGGATFRLALGEHAYSLTVDWTDATSNVYSKIERPFVLVEAGVATALFTAVLRPNNTSFNLGRALTALA